MKSLLFSSDVSIYTVEEAFGIHPAQSTEDSFSPTCGLFFPVLPLIEERVSLVLNQDADFVHFHDKRFNATVPRIVNY
ncbi:hypothetical protein HNY73_002858 [Argiope bruennichi]|uniref:Uncharacterized protein n=1 Tax=Argiope bruennichi TaxID=94029 RepID=A0A8T0FZG1_ARGBR|nr:hypothetical protein HNY73_002858 [Argiope bruennichi]